MIIRTLNSLNSFFTKASSWTNYKTKALKRGRELEAYLQRIDKIKYEQVTQNKEYVDRIEKQYKSLFNNQSDPRWTFFYTAISEIYSDNYIPHDIYVRRIEPQLNQMSFTSAYDDKNFYDTLFPDIKRPKTYLRIIGNNWYDKDYNKITYEEALAIINADQKNKVLKPALLGSGSGHGIEVFSPDEVSKTLGRVKKNKGNSYNSYIIQEAVRQPEVLEKYHSSSLNILKFLTLRINNEIVMVSSLMRFGIDGNTVDSKGYFSGVDENGNLKMPVLNGELNESLEHKDSKVSFKDVVVPSYKKAKEMCVFAHKRLPRFDLVSWDIAIDEQEEPVLIEINLKSQGIDKHQMVNGPLLGNHTMEVLSNIKF